MWLLVLVACGDVSNAVFAEDAEFVAVLPEEERTTLDLPGDVFAAGAKAEAGERPDLLLLSLDVAVSVNSVIFDILGLVDDVRGIAPSSRTPDSRGWGPIAVCGGDLSAAIVRTGASQFDWRFTGATPSVTTDILLGTHYAGSSVAAGDGQFVWDHAGYGAFCGEDTEGRLVVDYDNREGVDLLVHLDAIRSGSADVWDAAYGYRFVAGQGDFQYLTTSDLTGDGDPSTVAVRTRWLPDVGGRSDAVLTGGSLGDLVVTWTQCWGPDLLVTYQHDTLGLTPDLGAPSDCPYDDFATIDRI